MKKVNVNLGCGTNIVKGWINIDNVRPANADKDFVIGDALDIPLESNSVDYLLMDQVLEHLAMSDVVPALYEVRRVLKKGGRAVIIVPDFEDAVTAWMSARFNLSFDPLMYKYLSEVVYGNQQHEGEFHKTPMCAGYLHFVLGMVGLKKHEIIFYPHNGENTPFPGCRPAPVGSVTRNAQLVADIIKI